MLAVRARWLVLLLAALTALVLAGCAGITTSAMHDLGAQDRVGAFNTTAPTFAGLTVSRSACVRRGFTVSGGQMAAGFAAARACLP